MSVGAPGAPGSAAWLADRVRDEARALGFGLVGIAPPDRSEHEGFYRSWIEAGHHGGMGYLARPDAVDRRADLRRTLPEVRSVVVVGHEYHQEDPPGVPGDRTRGVFARYARGRDYHTVIEKKLRSLARALEDAAGRPVAARAYVDTGPLLERELGRRAGLGWFGKNTMLIHPRRGSYFFLGVLLLDLELPPDEPFAAEHCGTCRACLDACPTGALLGRDADGAPVMDARRCISYLTIEHRGPIPTGLRRAMGNRVFGCDICQEVCPWNERFARAQGGTEYEARSDLDGPSLVELAERLSSVDEHGFRAAFRGSPVLRARRAGLLRSVCVALGNWGSEDALPVLERCLVDPSPLVRAHAAWAMSCIPGRAAKKALHRAAASESDPLVQRELPRNDPSAQLE